MTRKVDAKTVAAGTAAAARAFTRRSLLKASAMGGAALAVAGPAILNPARAAGGEVRVFAWAGYLTDDMLAAFQNATGIKAVRTEYGTNDELLNQLRASQGGGFDIIWPTVDRVPNYVEFELVQPIDESKVAFDRLLPATISGSAGMGGVIDGKRYIVPIDWGTEALTFHKEQAPLVYGKASFGDLWRPEHAGKVTVRGHSALAGLGLYLEGEGKLPAPYADSFKDEATMTKNYDVIIAEAIRHKKNIGQFWTNENEAQGAFRANGCVIGQTWDSTSLALSKEGLPFGYIAPKEGALAWMEGVCITSKAPNLDNAYAFINWSLTPEAGAMLANHMGYNSTVKGADGLLNAQNKAFFAAAYPEDALDKLWWWPVQESWFVAKRTAYQDQLLSA
ncbi:extracellular solute-binding protein [Tistrella bauzanensis]|uniref:Extracellular solute-binding protein n=1 Tax=Tistrella arctica TaxID=3133430 RepID=A0ABU9YDW6_9PROT